MHFLKHHPHLDTDKNTQALRDKLRIITVNRVTATTKETKVKSTHTIKNLGNFWFMTFDLWFQHFKVVHLNLNTPRKVNTRLSLQILTLDRSKLCNINLNVNQPLWMILWNIRLCVVCKYTSWTVLSMGLNPQLIDPDGARIGSSLDVTVTGWVRRERRRRPDETIHPTSTPTEKSLKINEQQKEQRPRHPDFRFQWGIMVVCLN